MKARDVFEGSDGAVTKAYYAELEQRGPIGMVAMNLFRAQKCSTRAKVYRGGIRGQGSYRSMAYDRKRYSMQQLAAILGQHADSLAIRWGWKRDPKIPVYGMEWVLYVELPELGQVSFHGQRGAGPDYPGDWDGKHASEERILAFCDRVMGEPAVPPAPKRSIEEILDAPTSRNSPSNEGEKPEVTMLADPLARPLRFGDQAQIRALEKRRKIG